MSSGSAQSVPGSRRRLSSDQIVVETLARVEELGDDADIMQEVSDGDWAAYLISLAWGW